MGCKSPVRESCKCSFRHLHKYQPKARACPGPDPEVEPRGKRYLERTLKLKVSQDKSKVASTDQITFLGFTFRGTKVRWSEKAFRGLKRRVKRLSGRSWFVSMDYRRQKLAEYLRGWMGYFGIAEYYRTIPEIDQWLRRRLRMCYWKQRRRTRTRVRELLKPGTSLTAAIPLALGRKGPWHLARTLASQSGMTNRWLQEQGPLSVKELWVNIHYPATAR
jgi:RNA-directed DNA polymerase